MKKVLISLAVGTALVVPQMPASAACIHANPPEVHIPECVDAVDGPMIGGCGFAAATDMVAGGGQMTGEIDIVAVVYSANPAENPVSATITCYIKVNGATQPGAVCPASGTVVVNRVACVATYTSNSSADFVQLCQDVDYSGSIPDTSECFEDITLENPPPIFWEIVDPIVCAVLRPLAGTSGPGGNVHIDDDGDVYVFGGLWYDCWPDDGDDNRLEGSISQRRL